MQKPSTFLKLALKNEISTDRASTRGYLSKRVDFYP